MRLAILSDIHEDVVSLKMALHKIKKLGCDEIVCLGDISGFSIPHYRYFDTRNAHECLAIIRDNCSIIIAGNHDLYASKRIPAKETDFDFPDNWYDLDYYEREEIAKGKVWLYDHNELNPLYTKDDIKQLMEFPEQICSTNGKYNILFSHYIFPNLSGTLQEFHHIDNCFGPHLKYVQENNCNLGVVGHAHNTGLLIATANKVLRKSFNRKCNIEESSCIVVPSIAGNKIGNGFCVLDTNQGWIKALRL